MAINIIRVMVEGVILYAAVSWVMAFVVLVTHRDLTLPKTLRQLAKDAVVVAFNHPLDLAFSIYTLALRVTRSMRK